MWPSVLKLWKPKLRLAGALVTILLSSMTFAPAIGTSVANIGTCIQQMDRQIVDAGNVVSSQAVQDFAKNSAQFASASAGFNSTFMGFNDEWTVNKATCTASWHDAAANYMLQNTKGSKVLVISENPEIGVIYNVSYSGVQTAAIATVNSRTYSGYAMSINSGASTEITYASSNWYQPLVSAPTGTGAPSCNWAYQQPWTQCVLNVWVGLQNSTYDGPDHIPTHTAEVVQTGTQGNWTCITTCHSFYQGWNEYVRGNPSGTILVNDYRYCSGSMSVNDSITAQVGSQYYFNGTSGSTYYSILTDWQYSWICSHPFSNGEVHPEYYASFFAERPQVGGNAFNALPKFHTFTFYNVGMATGRSEFGAYPYYDSGYGFGSYIYNGGTTDTTTGSMSENSGSTFGYFSEYWVSSYGTP